MYVRSSLRRRVQSLDDFSIVSDNAISHSNSRTELSRLERTKDDLPPLIMSTSFENLLNNRKQPSRWESSGHQRYEKPKRRIRKVQTTTSLSPPRGRVSDGPVDLLSRRKMSTRVTDNGNKNDRWDTPDWKNTAPKSSASQLSPMRKSSLFDHVINKGGGQKGTIRSPRAASSLLSPKNTPPRKPMRRALSNKAIDADENESSSSKPQQVVPSVKPSLNQLLGVPTLQSPSPGPKGLSSRQKMPRIEDLSKPTLFESSSSQMPTLEDLSMSSLFASSSSTLSSTVTRSFRSSGTSVSHKPIASGSGKK